MDAIRQKVFDYLDSIDIVYDVIEHPAVYTIEEIDKLNIDRNNEIVKNLFVRDDKKKRFFIIVTRKDKQVDLKELRAKLSCGRLSFGSEDLLYSILGLHKGAVSPFGILNETDCKVEVIFDEDIKSLRCVGIHPNDNTATLWISPGDLEVAIKHHGNSFLYVKL